MEEADEIILLSLQSAGCRLPASVKTVADLASPELLVAVSARVLEVVSNGAVKLPRVLSPSVGERNRACTNMAKAIKELGYRGDIGYNLFLYPVERDVRRLLMFLIEKLPKTEEEAAEEAKGPAAALAKNIRTLLGAWKAQPWAPPALTRPAAPALKSMRLTVPAATRVAAGVPSAVKDFEQRFQPDPSARAQTGGDVPAFAASVLRRADERLARAAARRALLARHGVPADAPAATVAAALARVEEGSRRDLAASVRAALGGPLASLGGLRGPAFGASGVADAALPLDALVGRVRAAFRDPSAGLGSAFAHAADFAHEAAGPGADLVSGGGAGDAGGASAAAAAASATSAAAAGVEVKDEETLAREREEELAAMERAITAHLAAMEAATRQAATAAASLRTLRASVLEARETSADLQREYKLQRAALEMLPESERHIAELEAACGEDRDRLMALAVEWERHRLPLLESIRQLKHTVEDRRARVEALAEEAGRVQAEMRELSEQVRAKEAEARAAQSELEGMPQDGTSRATYTRRILDIVRQIRKQKDEIADIIADIRAVQADTSRTTEKLSRTAKAAEEGMFREARDHKDKPAYVQSFRSLTQLRELFANLVSAVELTGAADTEQRDLEAKCELLQQRATSRNMERVLADLTQIRAENTYLQRQLEAAGVRPAGGGAGGAGRP